MLASAPLVSLAYAVVIHSMRQATWGPMGLGMSSHCLPASTVSRNAFVTVELWCLMIRPTLQPPFLTTRDKRGSRSPLPKSVNCSLFHISFPPSSLLWRSWRMSSGCTASSLPSPWTSFSTTILFRLFVLDMVPSYRTFLCLVERGDTHERARY